MLLTCVEFAVLCLLPDYIPPPPPKIVTDYPAVMVIYDPSLCFEPGGAINCDGDPTTVAIGALTEDMWFTSGACHPSLLGLSVYFPGIDFRMRCVDNGGLVNIAYNEYYAQEVAYFDVMWDASRPPTWLYWLLDWYIVYD